MLLSLDALGQATRCCYDAAGNVLKVRNALSQVTTNTYTELGFLQATINPLNEAVSFGYDLAGNRKRHG